MADNISINIENQKAVERTKHWVQDKFPSIVIEVNKFYSGFLKQNVYWPKIYRFTLIHDIDKSLYALKLNLIKAYKSEKKATALRDADVELQHLQLLYYELHERRCIKHGYFKNCCMSFKTIGNMLGGWIKSDKVKNSRNWQ